MKAQEAMLAILDISDEFEIGKINLVLMITIQTLTAMRADQMHVFTIDFALPLVSLETIKSRYS